MSWYTNSKVWAFVGGVAASVIGGSLAKNPAVRKIAVDGVAKGMLAKETYQETVQSIKDDAEDVCADARIEAKAKAKREARMAEMEERIREQVEAEMQAEEEAEAVKARKTEGAKTTKPRKNTTN